MNQETLLTALKRDFGYDSFRALQEEIVRDAMAGHDVFVLLPTGGGKSLCFQLPAMIRGGLTVVVSPLIALMKDQVDALQANGIQATFLNSSLTPEETRKRWRELHEGKHRLLYVAPERLMLGDFIAQLRDWKVGLIAIDEAHCISEWGHDFRPEYRRLSELRDALPDTPMMALTATATERVRDDIVRHLHLKDPKRYVASFNRPNLNYTVTAKHKPFGQLLGFLRARPTESGIIYCQSRKTTESLADQLTENGIPANPYHAGLDAKTRGRHQDQFLRDDVQVICATIAFGMGINKSNVRFVVHYDLPKNVEGYYQETGRAGRDGLPSECLLLYSAGDAAKQNHFIDMKDDPHEQAIARRQLQDILHYAETPECRRKFLLGYFGEVAEPLCNACDNCLAPKSLFDGTQAAQKFLSCLYRVKQKSGFNVGLNHVIDVLRGSQNEKLMRWGHDGLSTYGIGKEFDKREWQSIGRELVRLGFLAQSDGMIATLELTAAGMATLTERRPVQLTQPLLPKTSAGVSARPASGDDSLFDHLRKLRKKLADERNVPAYIIFSDDSLRDMARRKPASETEFAQVRGVGEKKQKAFGKIFVQAIAEYQNP
jgi:ATP-dependent DNA helicase RecQ